MNNLLVIALGCILTALITAVGWQARTVIQNGMRLARLEAQMESMDLRSELSAVHRRIDEVAGIVQNSSGQLTQLNRSVNLMNAHLLEDTKGTREG